MYCPSCGTHNDDNNFRCIQCGHVLQQVGGPAPGAGYGPAGLVTEQVPNHLVQAILVTVFCCWPLGIPAIIAAASVNSKVAAGDLDGAWEASRKAKMWSMISLGLGLVVIVLQVVILLTLPEASPFNNF